MGLHDFKEDEIDEEEQGSLAFDWSAFINWYNNRNRITPTPAPAPAPRPAPQP